MLSFLSTFSESFLAALLAWPFLAFALTLPILIMQYRRFNKIIVSRAILIYAFMLYALGLVSFTLYPMPDNPATFCTDYHLSPELNPLKAFLDIQSDGMQAVLQLVMNLLFFVPFGMFARILFGWKLLRTTVASLLLSLAIETAQLTGMFGIYPCSYRLFDTNDLIINTLGGIVGYGLATLIPKRELEYANKESIVRQPGLLRMAVALVIDQAFATILGILLVIAAYFIYGEETTIAFREWLYVLALAFVHIAIPFVKHGRSVGSWLIRLTHDNVERTTFRRIIFYGLRGAYLWLLLLPLNGFVTLLVIAVTVFTWKKWKKLPYQII